MQFNIIYLNKPIYSSKNLIVLNLKNKIYKKNIFNLKNSFIYLLLFFVNIMLKNNNEILKETLISLKKIITVNIWSEII